MKKINLQKISSVFWNIINFVEILMAIIVFIGVIISIIDSIPMVANIWSQKKGMAGLNQLIESIFSVVIAVEFLKMLLKPTSKTVIEVLVFLIARHMIVQKTSVVEDLISVISICLLLILQFFLKKMQSSSTEKEKNLENSNENK